MKNGRATYKQVSFIDLHCVNWILLVVLFLAFCSIEGKILKNLFQNVLEKPEFQL